MFEALLARGEHLARIEAERARLRFVNGVDWLLRDPKSVVGQTPYDVVWKDGIASLRRYRLPGVKPKHKVPLLLVPPLMVQAFIFDLHGGRSMVRYFLERGYRVYLLDFGRPNRSDAFVSLENYVCDWIPAANAAAMKEEKAKSISLLGYCMGALFAMSHAAVSRDRAVKNIVSIAAPMDTRKMGMLAWVMQRVPVDQVAKRVGNVPGPVSALGFRMLTPAKNLTRYADLFMNMYDQEYVNGFDSMNQWMSQLGDYPQEAFVQFTRDFMKHNKLYKGQMKFRGKLADLKQIRSAMLSFAGKGDQVAPPSAVKAAMSAVGSKDKTYLEVKGGHMGVFAGSGAPKNVWGPAADWLSTRSKT